MTDTNTDAADAVDQLRAHPAVHVHHRATINPADPEMQHAARTSLTALDEDIVGRITIDPRAETHGGDGYYWPDGLVAINTDTDDVPFVLSHEVGHNVYDHVRPDLTRDAWRDARLLAVDARGPEYPDGQHARTEAFCYAFAWAVVQPRMVTDEYPAFWHELCSQLSRAGLYHVLPQGSGRYNRVHAARSRIMRVVG